MPEPPHDFGRHVETLIGEFRGVPPDGPPKMRRRPTREMAAVIEELLVKHRIGRAAPEEAIRENWASIVGEANASYSHPARIERGRRLLILASHPVVRNELFLNRETILDRIRKLAGCGDITGLHVRAG